MRLGQDPVPIVGSRVCGLYEPTAEMPATILRLGRGTATLFRTTAEIAKRRAKED